MDGPSDARDDGSDDPRPGAGQSEGDRSQDVASPENPSQDVASPENPSQNDARGWLLDRFDQVTLFRVVLALTALALALRLVGLGARTAHWDEARVAYWAHFYTDTGSVAYHYEEHGPLVQIVAGRLFEAFGTNDFVARLPVAVVGGLFPLSAYLFRKHLRRTEVITLALFFTLNPVLLYYSRFMRSDILVAAFMFTAFGLLVRYYDTRLTRYAIVAGVFVGLGFASKENASIYVLTWAGAVVVLIDQYLHSPASEDSGLDRLRTRFGDTFRAVYRFVARLWGTREPAPDDGSIWTAIYWAAGGVLTIIGFVLSSVLTVVYLFAPRGEGLAARGDPFGPFRPIEDPTTLNETIANPLLAPQLIDDTLRMTYDGYKEWFTGSGETTLSDYLDVLFGGYLEFMVETLPLLVGFAVVGIVLERFVRARPRTLVMFMCYCGVASIVGYPLGSDIGSDYAWISSHIVVPLAVPASVALAGVYRASLQTLGTARESLSTLSSGVDLDWFQYGSIGMAGVVLVAACVVLFLLVNPLTMVFVDNQTGENDLVQYAQPASDLSPAVDSMNRIAAEHEGDDVVLYYGEQGVRYDSNDALVQEDISPETLGGWEIYPLCSRWGNTQPLNWYFAATGANATCERKPKQLQSAIEEDPPPVIIGTTDDQTLGFGTNETSRVPGLESEYDRETYYIRTFGEEVVVYTHESWAE